MWNIGIDYTPELARQFLLEDFLKVVLRTRFLYVEALIPPTIGRGYYEPVILCLCWCDFLGALYCGDGKMGHTDRSKRFIEEVMGHFNPSYRSVSGRLVKTYRHGPVHAFAPAGSFNIRTVDDAEHLKQAENPDYLIVSVKTLLDDLEKSVRFFAENLKETGDAREASIRAFNNARRDLLRYTSEGDRSERR